MNEYVKYLEENFESIGDNHCYLFSRGVVIKHKHKDLYAKLFFNMLDDSNDSLFILTTTMINREELEQQLLKCNSEFFAELFNIESEKDFHNIFNSKDVEIVNIIEQYNGSIFEADLIASEIKSPISFLSACESLCKISQNAL